MAVPDPVKKLYEADITQVIAYCGTIYKHHPQGDWFIVGNF